MVLSSLVLSSKIIRRFDLVSGIKNIILECGGHIHRDLPQSVWNNSKAIPLLEYHCSQSVSVTITVTTVSAVAVR